MSWITEKAKLIRNPLFCLIAGIIIGGLLVYALFSGEIYELYDDGKTKLNQSPEMSDPFTDDPFGGGDPEEFLIGKFSDGTNTFLFREDGIVELDKINTITSNRIGSYKMGYGELTIYIRGQGSFLAWICKIDKEANRLTVIADQADNGGRRPRLTEDFRHITKKE
tara:strand:- start:243 stop:740 length:498 start_codon:yes stop_codon:yes gene_type:complete